MLQINQFRKAYHSQLVPQIDHFTIVPGIYWVQGSNGSGKHTLLKAIGGILPSRAILSFMRMRIRATTTGDLATKAAKDEGQVRSLVAPPLVAIISQ